VNTRHNPGLLRPALGCITLAVLLGLGGCESSGYDTHTSVSVGYGYGGYYDPYYGPGYYPPYPPVVVVPPDGERPPGERPPPEGGNRPTTLPADVGGPSTKPAMPPPRPSASSRPTSRPAPRPAPRPMPRGGGGRRR